MPKECGKHFAAGRFSFDDCVFLQGYKKNLIVHLNINYYVSCKSTHLKSRLCNYFITNNRSAPPLMSSYLRVVLFSFTPLR